ncbi:MAG TPA: di-heme oxidoredictase family protein [Terriglobia bacterium]|nr:di-heme oxidoredictase family protein [Terriglobia bacterium]
MQSTDGRLKLTAISRVVGEILCNRLARNLKGVFMVATVALLATGTASRLKAQTATDPGVRGGPPGAGQFIAGLDSDQQGTEQEVSLIFKEVNRVAGGNVIKEIGLGGPFDSNGCAACHAQPAPGGSSLASNPLFGVYQLMGATNIMPVFETTNGPTVVARFPYQSDLKTPNGLVQQLFTITGRSDAGTCNIPQPDFTLAMSQNNLILRQTTPAFGGGLLEIIQDSDILANMNANLSQKLALGISGHPNIDANDGSIDRFGWKAQTRSLMAFSAEAYLVEEGVSDEFTPNKLNESPGCTPPFPEGPPNGQGSKGVPDDRTSFPFPLSKATGAGFTGDPQRFAIFQRFLDQPKPGSCPGGNPASCTNGETQFNNVGCVLCHTQSFTTPQSTVAALSNVQTNLYSDILVHHMGGCLADNVVQGSAMGDEFRTAPLWGVGQRVFFMHDGRTSNIVTAVEDHLSTSSCPNSQYPPSEANAVVGNFNALSPTNQQDLINFLRSL